MATFCVFLVVFVGIFHPDCSSAISPTPTFKPPAPTVEPTLPHVSPTGAAAEDPDACTAWEKCPIHRDPKVQTWLSRLPNCPCQYPISILTNDSIFDPVHREVFSWRRVYQRSDRARQCHRSAVHCIRQQLTNASTSPAVQVCCYGGPSYQLVTRGPGAGSAYLVAPELSTNLAHEKLDLFPLVACGGDWTRYQALRPPNNGLNCSQFPSDVEYRCAVEHAKDY